MSGRLGMLTKRQRAEEIITFSDEDVQGVQYPHNDPVVITIGIAEYDVHRVLISSGSSADVLFYDAFSKMGFTSDRLRRFDSPPIRLFGEVVPVKGVITLPVTAGRAPRESTVHLDFLVVKIFSAYNVILGRPGLNALQAVVSTYHLLVKFPTRHGVGEIRGDQALARQCHENALREARLRDALQRLDAHDELTGQHGEPVEGLITVPFKDGNEKRTIQVRSHLDEITKHCTGTFLQQPPPSSSRADPSQESNSNENFKMKYPAMIFQGQIIYSRTAPEVELATKEILDKINAMKHISGQVALGFDIEWRPVFKRGEASRKAAVMQICMDNSHCYVMHIIHSGIPPILKSLLEGNSSVKVGIGVAKDASKISKDYNVCVEPVEDLSSLANLKIGGAPRNWSLSSLTEMITCKQLEKPHKIRLGNWEIDVLSREQLQYAATDAFASWYLYQALKGFPDAKAEAEDVN